MKRKKNIKRYDKPGRPSSAPKNDYVGEVIKALGGYGLTAQAYGCTESLVRIWHCRGMSEIAALKTQNMFENVDLIALMKNPKEKSAI